jgi:hypothetical protein
MLPRECFVPRIVYLVGSVPFESTEAVFRTVCQAVGPLLEWLPDGETGERLDWITWLEPIFAASPALQPSGKKFQLHPGASPQTRYTLRPGRRVEDITLDNLFYADNAIRSFETFSKLKRDGTIPAHVKFQVDLVPAHSVLWLYIEDELQAALDPIYNAAVKREIDKIAKAIPAAELAIQLDVASAVFARLERAQASSYGADKSETQQRFADILVDLASHVPRDIDLLFHFCYGDAGHKHVVEPTDMSDMVVMANSLSRRIERPIQLIHMPVPRDRSDARYFEPLKSLKLGPETMLCLGLVHHTDGIAGTAKRLAMAKTFVADFAIGTECGFGRRPVETIPALLQIHREAAEM